MKKSNKIERSLDYVCVPLRWLEDKSDISDKLLGAVVRLASYYYKRPDVGNKIVGAKMWNASKWIVNCSGLQAKTVKMDITDLWHWEGDDLVCDCLLEGVEAGMNRRKINSRNAKGDKEGSSGDGVKDGLEGSSGSAIALQRLNDCTTSISKSKVIKQSQRREDESFSSCSNSPSFNDEAMNMKFNKNLSQDESVEETRAEFAEMSEENKARSLKQSVINMEEQGARPLSAISTETELMEKALETSKEKDFMTWAKDIKGVYSIESLRMTPTGQIRILELTKEYENGKAQVKTEVKEDDIPF